MIVVIGLSWCLIVASWDCMFLLPSCNLFMFSFQNTWHFRLAQDFVPMALPKSSSAESLTTAWVLKINQGIWDEDEFTEIPTPPNPNSNSPGLGSDSSIESGEVKVTAVTSVANMALQPGVTCAPPHGVGDDICDPCIFFFSDLGCFRAETCPYCHLHQSETRPRKHRPCKAKREKIKKRVSASLSRLGLLWPET